MNEFLIPYIFFHFPLFLGSGPDKGTKSCRMGRFCLSVRPSVPPSGPSSQAWGPRFFSSLFSSFCPFPFSPFCLSFFLKDLQSDARDIPGFPRCPSPVCLSICLPACLFGCLFVCHFVCLSVYLNVTRKNLFFNLNGRKSLTRACCSSTLQVDQGLGKNTTVTKGTSQK